MYSSGVYHLNRSGIVESIENNNIVVRLDKLNEQDEDLVFMALIIYDSQQKI